MHWNEENIPDLAGKTAIVTGANSGIGFETALQLARHNCHVILACRNLNKAQEAINQIKHLKPDAKVAALALDLTDMKSINDFILKISEFFQTIDLLINNAGILNIPFTLTVDGLETIYTTNFLGPFALTAKLLPLLAPDARIITVGSNTVNDIHPKNLDMQSDPKKFARLKEYTKSKLAELNFAFELDRRLKANNLNIISVGAHPGCSATHVLESHGGKPNNIFFRGLFAFSNRFFAQSAAKGALPILYAATAANVQGGEYYGPNGFKEMWGRPKLTHCVKEAYDATIAKTIWQQAENITKVKFNLNYPNLQNTKKIIP